MKNIYFRSLLLFSLLSTALVTAQQDFELALYNYHTGIYNPAFVGTQGSPFLNTSFRSQWFGIKDAPRIQAITLGFPSGENRAAYGLMVTHDDTFVERQTRFFGTFSYRLPLNPKWDLHLGISAGGNNLAVNFNELENLQQVGDGLFQNYSHFNPNIGVGAYLKSERFYFSLSVPQLLGTQRYKDKQGISTTAKDRPHLYAISGLRIPLKGDWTWIHSALFRYVSDAPTSMVINSGLGYRKIEATVGYQIKAGISGTLMIQEFEQYGMALGYSYQMPTTNDLRSLTGGNHEILLRIRLGKPKNVLEDEILDEKKVKVTKTGTK